MQYASKINFSIDSSLLEKSEKPFANIETVFDSYSLKKRREILKLLPKELQNGACVWLTHISFDRGLDKAKVHKHTKEKCVLNVYLETNNEETIFYEGQEKIIPLENGKSSYIQILDPTTLNKKESFIAKPKEAWLLKTNKPHSVFSTEKEGVRKILQIYFFSLEYEEVLLILKEYYG